ncbi:hypothetical protein [Sphingobacterium sp. SYP-B4668]|uniref:hypothetical protein n=1 Tax=Sphingobacterium sp. SYP-B4668 TaxID=2996035 RepID=UPI0022DE77BC|nr:hypothetical protein [Sphingobacterium sp. SYP-B4668]
MTKIDYLVAIGSLGLLLAFGCTGHSAPIFPTLPPNRYTVYENGDTSTFQLQYDADNRIVSYECPAEGEITTFRYDRSGRLHRIEMIDETEIQDMEISYSEDDLPVSAVISIRQKETFRISGRKFIDYEVKEGRVTRMKILKTGGKGSQVDLSYSGNNLEMITTTGNAGYVSNKFELGPKRSPFAIARLRHVLNPDLPIILGSEHEITGHTIVLSEGMAHFTKIDNHYNGNGNVLCVKEEGANMIVSKNMTVNLWDANPYLENLSSNRITKIGPL